MGISQSVELDGNDVEGFSGATDVVVPKFEDIQVGWSSEKKKFPKVTHKDVEKYIIHASHRTENNVKMQCYRQFIRGYNFYKEGYIHKMMTNQIDDNCEFCYIRSKCFPSMKNDVVYTQWVLTTKPAPYITLKASCTCPAG